MTSGGSLVVLCPCVPLAFVLCTREMWPLHWLAKVCITHQKVVTSSVTEADYHLLSEGGRTAVAKPNIAANQLVFTDTNFYVS